MIRRSLLTAFVALVAFHLCHPMLPRKFHKINGVRRQNLDRVERFIFSTNTEPGMILGSSMSLGLDNDVLGPGWRKLTFPGCSILTSLELLRRSGKIPKVVLVECNQCTREANQDVLDDAFNPFLTLPRRHSKLFFEEARPSNFLIPFTEACLSKAFRIPYSRKVTPELFSIFLTEKRCARKAPNVSRPNCSARLKKSLPVIRSRDRIWARTGNRRPD